MRRALLAASVALLASCSLLTSLDGLSGGDEPSEAGAEAETGTPMSEAGASDATSDGETGAVDGGFCANQDAAFCDDFTRADAADTKGPWASIEAYGGPSLGVVDDALRVQVPMATVTGSRASTVRPLPVTTHITYAYDILVASAPTDGTYQVNNLAVYPTKNGQRGADFAVISLYLRGDGFHVATQLFPQGNSGTFKLIDITRQIPTNTLTHVVFDADVSAGKDPRLVVTFDGVQTYAGTLDPAFTAGEWEVHAGISYLQSNTTYTDIRVDNAVVQIAP